MTHARLAQSTFNRKLSPLEQAAAQLIPQSVNIALSIRELIRQGYLYSAALLLRPMIERVGLVKYLNLYPDAVQAWHNGWPRQDQPSLQTLLETASEYEADGSAELKDFTKILHKIIHPDPAGALWNMITLKDGKQAFSSGKILNDPEFCDFISVTGSRFLSLVTQIAEDIFGKQEQST
jgi:hypothetical protein